MHQPVLLHEVLEYLNPQPGGVFIDATINGGGHSQAIAERIGKKGKLLGIDRDRTILNSQALRGKIQRTRHKLVCDSFVNIRETADLHGFTNVNGILFDLGFSSFHVDESGRGFSFQKDEPLDMRYNAEEGVTAADIVNSWPREKLEVILKEYGEERFYRRIAKVIMEARKRKSIKTTYELVDVIRGVMPGWYRRGRIHFATRTFQALRIAVNDELHHVAKGVEESISLLAPGGRVAVLSFHSLEDRIIKDMFRRGYKEGMLRLLTKKPVRVGERERNINPRARSAKLRVAERV